MESYPVFSMPSRLELRWKNKTLPSDMSGNDMSGNDMSGNDMSGNDISGNDISGSTSDCCSDIAELDVYINGIVSILSQINARGDIQTADNRFDLLISTITARLNRLR